MTANQVLSVAWVLLVFGYLCWRAALPNNRWQGGVDFAALRTDGATYYVPRNTNSYENTVTRVTARHFERDGFWRTHLLPNRGGAPNVSLYDFSYTQCEPLTPRAQVPSYHDAFGHRHEMLSLNGDCIYTHYPPLADWIFGGLASIGLSRVLHYKVFAIALNCGFLLVFQAFLRRVVPAPAAFVALLFAATVPTFVDWADTLYYHCLHFLLLSAAISTLSLFLARARRLWLGLTWFFYFALALCSYQLTLFFAVVLIGLSFLEAPRVMFRSRLPVFALTLSAPIAAFLLHTSLIVSLFGFARTWRNLLHTVRDRVTEVRLGGGIGDFLSLLSDNLMPWPFMVLGVGLLSCVFRAAKVPSWPRFCRLSLFFVGGISFMVALPGTTSWHSWMMYRQLLPFAVLLVAYLSEALLIAVELAKRGQGRRARLLGACGAVLCSAFLGQSLVQNLRHLQDDVAWNLLRNRHVDETNLTRRALDIVYWADEPTPAFGSRTQPVSGLRTGEPPAWATDLRLVGPSASHYEIWWLDAVELKTLQVLLNRRQLASASEHCDLSAFDGDEFRALPQDTRLTELPFVPRADESPPREPYAWLHYSLPSVLRSRAIRLTCTGVAVIVLRQIEVFST